MGVKRGLERGIAVPVNLPPPPTDYHVTSNPGMKRPELQKEIHTNVCTFLLPTAFTDQKSPRRKNDFARHEQKFSVLSFRGGGAHA